MSTEESESDTASLYTLTGSLQQQLYRYQGERRVQAINPDYTWPCDKTAATVELVSALVMEKTYANGLHWAPPDRPNAMEEEVLVSSDEGQPARVLDLGSGTTATWAISMAERYPRAECIGLDLVPAELSYLPANLSIEIHDLLEGLPYPDEYLSLIHCRFGGAFSNFFDNPNFDFLADVARTLRPGGVLLLEEVDNVLTPFRSRDPNCPFLPLIQHRHALRFATQGPRSVAPMDFGERMGRLVRETEGFALVLEDSFELPLGTRKDQGPPERQRGFLQRQGWLDVLVLQGAAVGMNDRELEEARRVDEGSIPVEDVGVFVKINVVWAVKGGGRS